MEQILGTFGIDWRLLLIQAFNFGLVLVVLWYFLYRPVNAILDERKEKIARGVTEAAQAAGHLKRAEEMERETIAQAGKDAEAIVGKAEKHAAEKERELLAVAEEKSSRLLAEAQKRADEERRKALESSKEEIARMAVLAAEKIMTSK